MARRSAGRSPHRRRARALARARPGAGGAPRACRRAVSLPSGPTLSRGAAVAVDRVAVVALGDDGRDAGVDVHAVLGVRAVEIAGDVVELREGAAFAERDEQLDVAQGALELGGDALAQVVEALAADGRDEGGVGVAEGELAAALVVEPVGLVEHED